jgi:ribonuclease P protein component
LHTPVSYRFTKKEKLKSRKAITALFTSGKSFSNFPLRIVWSESLDGEGLQVGVSAGTRYFKKAVDRNRVKRLMREAIRLQKNELQDVLIATNKSIQVFVIYQSNELPQYADIYPKIGKVLQRLAKLMNEKSE